MTIYFSHSGGLVTGFYDSGDGNTPAGTVQITDEQHQAAIIAQSAGMELATDGATITPRQRQPTQSEQESTERSWARSELSRTDFILLSDSSYTEPQKKLVRAYRAALKNPARTTHPDFPAQAWRPTFPKGVKEPD